MKQLTLLLAVAALSTSLASSALAQTAEVCGNGVDDDADGFTDESCYPGLTAPLVDSPISTRATGLVSPSTGSLYYPVTPDVRVRAAAGPDLRFQRTYASMINPGASAPAYKKPMGDRWTHNFMGWITNYGTSLVVRLPTGQDIVATFVSGCDYQTRAGQATKRILHCSSDPSYSVELLDGTKLFYSTLPFSGPIVLRGIQRPTIGAISIEYDAATHQIDYVGASMGNRILYFGYTGNLLTSITLDAAGAATHNTSFSYTGNNLTSVTIGGQLAQTNVYTNNYLTQIQDGGGTSIVSFAYDSATPGKVARVDTQQGMVGFELAATRTGCSGSDKTIVYFNRGNTTSCSVDGDCGSGFLCGGKTGTGSTGQCFRAARCMTVDKTAGHHEDLVTAVSPLGPPGQTCEGACTDVEQYLWNNSTTFVASLGVKDPSGNYTIRAVNANGLPTHIAFGDPDSTPTNGNAARNVWLKYSNATFPGLVTEIRRPSELHASRATCSPSAGDGCKITSIQYSNGGKPSLVTETGTTLSTSGTDLVYSFSTSYSYDNYGRLTQIDGPLAGTDDITTFTFYDTGDPMKDWYVATINRKKDASSFITTTLLEYDIWGNPTVLRGADTTTLPSSAPGSLTCLTFSSSRGHLTQRREMMAGQTSCASPNAADLVTTWTRDSALRLTQLTRPDGSCMFYEYDTKGRLQRTKRRDDCSAASAGDRQEYIYDAEGLVTEVQTYDAANVLTAKQPYTYFDSRKLQSIVNPVDPSKWTGIVYDSRGLVSEIDAPGALGKTRFNRDLGTAAGRDGRITSEDRFKDATAFDSWSLAYDWSGNQFTVTDGDSKTTETVRDDMGRTVRLTSPDMTHPTLYIYDNAGRLTTVTEAFGGGSAQQTHNFTFDHLGRLLTGEYNGRCPTGTAHAEIIQQYDAPPSCPSGMTCARTGGRLAYVKVTLMCSSAYADGALDQETWFSYDDAGRLVREYIKDDTGRIADHVYSWTKNGALAQVSTPSGAVLGRTFGSTSSNSDTDRVTALWRTNSSTPVIDAIEWNPFGPLKQYNQQNKISNKLQRTAIARNLAYRITSISVENQTNGNDTFSVTVAEDAKGRVTMRDYSNAASGVEDSYFLYDHQDRVLCETTSLVSSCPTSGTNIKNSRTSPYFTEAGDWNQLLRPVPGSTGGLMNSFNPTGYGTSHQVTLVRQNDGSPALGDTVLAYDARGNRISDDNTSTLTNDRRDYTYDQRGNVINVHGKYFTGGVWHDYDVASAFDAKNRRVFKSFLDNVTGIQAHWLFYYDPLDRLIEIEYTPDITLPNTRSVFQLVWLGGRLVLYWQTDYPSIVTSRRYLGTDETGRPIDMWTWPSSGNGSRVWAVNASAWGTDTNVVGPSLHQPILFPGQYSDIETASLHNTGVTQHRPGLVLNGFRTYDPLTGGYLQVDGIVAETWSSYGYADSCPVGKSDPSGFSICEGPENCTSGDQGTEIGYGTPVCSLQCWVSCQFLGGIGCDCTLCKPAASPCGPPCHIEYDIEGQGIQSCVCPDDNTAPVQPPVIEQDVWEPSYVRVRSRACRYGAFTAGALPAALLVVAGCYKSDPKYPEACPFLAGFAGVVAGAITSDASTTCNRLVPDCGPGWTPDLSDVRPPGLRVASGSECASVLWPNPANPAESYCCVP